MSEEDATSSMEEERKAMRKEIAELSQQVQDREAQVTQLQMEK
jgi:hypothetical protein